MKQNYQLQNIAAASQDLAFVDESARLTATTGTPGAGQFRSSITGRASIPDIANDFRASLGVERIMTQQIYPLQDEFGPNGEPVWAAMNDTRGLIRFVGGGWYSDVSISGYRCVSSNVNDYIEVVFYGTGLNFLYDTSGSSADLRVTVDSGSEGGQLFSATPSNVLGYRNYNTNSILNATSSLSLGVHTVKIRLNSGAFRHYGFEILNSNASGLVNVNPGKAYYRGKKVKNTAADSIAYNTGVTGTKGGRIVRYFTGNDAPTQAFRAVDTSAAYLTNADHSNEEVARTYHWREFGAGRSDDFSIAVTAASAKAFTLDDGTTSLACDNIYVTTTGGFLMNVLNGFWTFTFVGTGLDILKIDIGSGTLDTSLVYIDGVSTGLPLGTGSLVNDSNKKVVKICSGLPYGTHTVKIVRTSYAVGFYAVLNFIVYQPKKPMLPTGAVEICDYNVMGDYGTGSSSSGSLIVAPGTLRKPCIREHVYAGTWSGPTIATDLLGGWYVNTGTATSFLQYTFFGTGTELSFNVSDNVAVNSTVTVTNLSTGSIIALNNYTTSLLQSTSGLTWTSSTGAIGGTSSIGTSDVCRLKISGLPVGIYSLKLTQNTTTQIYFLGMDIITPIHSYKSNLPAVLQNTLPVGSQSLMDSRVTSPTSNSLVVPKAWSQAVGVTSNPTTASTSYVPVPDLSCTLKTNGGSIEISYSISMTNSTGGFTNYAQIYVDGIAVGTFKEVSPGGNSYGILAADNFIVPVSAGVHKIDLYWKVNAGTATALSMDRTLVAKER